MSVCIYIYMHKCCVVMAYGSEHWVTPPPHAGELLTTAGWMRRFICSHPDYKKDSVVSEVITYDLIRTAREISEGYTPCPELTGTLASKTPPEYHVAVCSSLSTDT